MLQYETLEKLFEKRFNSYLNRFKKIKELKQANIHPYAISKSISHSPIILGSSNTRMSILNLGEIINDEKFYNEKFLYPLGYTCKRKYRPYQNKKVDQQPNTQTEKKESLVEEKPVKDDKIFYWMTINENGCIVGCDGKEWKSWEEFTLEFNKNEITDVKKDNSTDQGHELENETEKETIEPKIPTFTTHHKIDGMSFEEFFGFTNLQLQKLLEQKMYIKYRDGISGYLGYHKE